MKRLLSLFDYSGLWSQPFYEGGWDVIQWDIKLSEFMDINLIDSAETALDLFEHIDGIIAAPPCTEFTNAGAQYWTAKDRDGRTQQAVEMVFQVKRLADLFTPTDPDWEGTFFWVAENPVGRMGKLTGLDNPYYFDPCDFAAWLKLTEDDYERLNYIRMKNGHGVTNEENNFVVAHCNAYTKKTGLWGGFNRGLVKRPIDPVKTSPQGTFTQRYGGKSEKTKEARSNTPLGFSYAFYEANKNYNYLNCQECADL